MVTRFPACTLRPWSSPREEPMGPLEKDLHDRLRETVEAASETGDGIDKLVAILSDTLAVHTRAILQLAHEIDDLRASRGT